MTQLGRAAQWYAGKLGWKVFPLAPRSKIPAIKGGRGCLDASDDPGVITAWWEAMPNANIGLATGYPSGFWVLDVDPRNGGDESFEEAVRVFGPFPETVEGLTGGGGRHVLFECVMPEFYGIKWTPIAPGLDCKGTGGYIVAPPSIHPDTGRAYAWEASARPEEVPLAKTPERLARLLGRNIDKHRGKDRGLVKSCAPASFPIGKLFAEFYWLGEEFKPGTWAVRCPGENLHSSGERFDTSTVLFAPGPGQGSGFFWCSHSHCQGLFSRFDVLSNMIRRISEREGL